MDTVLRPKQVIYWPNFVTRAGGGGGGEDTSWTETGPAQKQIQVFYKLPTIEFCAKWTKKKKKRERERS
jgi:hypothetical protein